jgi:spoIIIJ-associated protein
MIKLERNNNQFRDDLKKFLTFMFEELGETPDITTTSDSAGLLVEISLDDPAPYIGKNGEGLASIQHLVKSYMSRKVNPMPQFMIDIGDYKRKQISILKNIAINESIKVRKTGKSVELSPMSPFARRIIHLTVKDQPQVTSYSIGEGEQRRIVIDVIKSE